jgi:hypothetical protein
VRVRAGPRKGAAGAVVSVLRVTEAARPHDEALVCFPDGSADYFDVGHLEPANESDTEIDKKGGGR